MWSILYIMVVQVVLDEETLREALREHLRRRKILELDERERRGYERCPDSYDPIWERVQAWSDV